LDDDNCCVDVRGEDGGPDGTGHIGFACDSDVARPMPSSGVCSGITKSEPGTWGMQGCDYTEERGTPWVTCCL